MEKSNDTIVRQKKFIRLPEVLSRTGYGRTTIYRKMEDGDISQKRQAGRSSKRSLMHLTVGQSHGLRTKLSNG